LSLDERSLVESSTGIRIIGTDPDRHRSSKYEDMYGMLRYPLTVPREQNFLLLKWFFDPNAPYNPPDKFYKTIDVDTSQLPKEREFYTSLRHFSDANAFSQEECVYLRELYLAEVASMDERIGFVLKTLESRDLLHSTIFVFTSDHGEFFGEHDRLHHGRSYFEPVVNVPLIFSGPGIPREEAIPDPVSLVKLIPIINDLLVGDSLETDPARQFHNLLARHTGLSHSVYMDRIANRFMDRYIDYDALLSDGYKLVTFLEDGKPVFQLFDLVNDAEEINDISAEFPNIVRTMYKTILQLRHECDLRLEQNLGTMDSDSEVNRVAKKTRDQMKALGYIK
jgi:arylsulfatase A-like enzyme